MTPPLWQKMKKNQWASWSKESEKAGLKLNIKKSKILSLHGKQMGKQWKQWLTLFWEAPKSLQMLTAAMKWKDAYSLEEKLWST